MQLWEAGYVSQVAPGMLAGVGGGGGEAASGAVGEAPTSSCLPAACASLRLRAGALGRSPRPRGWSLEQLGSMGRRWWPGAGGRPFYEL